jgi:hypothetical protein
VEEVLVAASVVEDFLAEEVVEVGNSVISVQIADLPAGRQVAEKNIKEFQEIGTFCFCAH